MEKLSGILESKHKGFFIIITETFIGGKNPTAGKEIFHQRHSYVE